MDVVEPQSGQFKRSLLQDLNRHAAVVLEGRNIGNYLYAPPSMLSSLRFFTVASLRNLNMCVGHLTLVIGGKYTMKLTYSFKLENRC